MRVPRRKADRYRVLPHVPRDSDRVPTNLWAAVDALVSGRANWPLYLWGNVGTGKTRAALSITDRLEFARYWTVDVLKDLVLAKRAPWDWPTTPRVAILDELGLSELTRFEYDVVKRFCDWREHAPAIYISNHPPEMLRNLYDLRIESRVGCGLVYQMKGPDRRRVA